MSELLEAPPLLHVDDGRAVSWGLSDMVLEFLAARLGPSAATLETGEGVSTILFAILRTTHVCVTPNVGAVERIQGYCAAHNLPLDQVKFEMGPSEDVLPHLDLPLLDAVIIDGAHGLPAPFLDWYYACRGLKVGGVVVVDDVRLWPCGMLADFLASEPGWKEVATDPGRARVFERTEVGPLIRFWGEQAMVNRENERRNVHVVRRAAGKAKRGLKLLIRGDLRTFSSKVAKNLRGRPW